MDNQIAWVTGAGGLIGSQICQTSRAAGSAWSCLPLHRKELDLLNFADVRRRYREERPRIIIHCAALTRNTECDANPALARKTNVELTAFLAELAADSPFVFFSTDLVFDGQAGNYRETAAVNPLTCYAETKATAEQMVLRNPRHTVIRVSLTGGISPTGDRGFNEVMRLTWQTGGVVRLFIDEYRSPLPAVVAAEVVWQLIHAQAHGLFHVAGAERLSRWEIGRLIAARWPQLHPRIEKTSLRDYRGAPRSPDTSLNCDKVQSLLDTRLPGLNEWLQQHQSYPF